MLFPGIKKLGKEYGLFRSCSGLMGTVNNNYIRLYDGNNMKVLEFSFPKADPINKNDLSIYLNSIQIKKHEWTGTTLIITFPEYIIPYPIKNISKVITHLSKYSCDHYPNEKVVCQKCKISTEVNPYSLSDEPLYLCNDCARNLELEFQNQKHKYESIPKNYLIGTIGALLFSLPGLIITVILFIFLNRIAAMSTVVYVFLASKGYSYFKGKTDKVWAIILTVYGLALSYIGILVSNSTMILYKTKSLENTLELLKKPEIQNEISTNIIIGLIFCSLYLVGNFISLLGEWKFPILKKNRKF